MAELNTTNVTTARGSKIDMTRAAAISAISPFLSFDLLCQPIVSNASQHTAQTPLAVLSACSSPVCCCCRVLSGVSSHV
jgi:hypothetical protein